MSRHRNMRQAYKDFVEESHQSDDDDVHDPTATPKTHPFSPNSSQYMLQRATNDLDDWSLEPSAQQEPYQRQTEEQAHGDYGEEEGYYDNEGNWHYWQDEEFYGDGEAYAYDEDGYPVSGGAAEQGSSSSAKKKKKKKKKKSAKTPTPAAGGSAANSSSASAGASSNTPASKSAANTPAGKGKAATSSSAAAAGGGGDSGADAAPVATPTLTRSVSAVRKYRTPSKKAMEARQKLIDEYIAAQSKPHLNMVVIGHVDAGKSTLMGHLLFLKGHVDKRQMHKYEQESKNAGKGSFAFAWVLDQHKEERARGVTVDVAMNHFETENRYITLLDAPGHRDFIPNMISGAAQAEVAILVVEATTGEFEGGFSDNGQTKEHAILARSLGVGQVIVAVNKMDNAAPAWSKKRYDHIVEQLASFLEKQAGFTRKNIWPVPVSGLTGENIVKRTVPALSSWYSGPTLMELIDRFDPPSRQVERPFRMSISDVFWTQALGVTVGGKIESGAVVPKDQLLLLPQGEIVTVKGVEQDGEGSNVAVAGDNVELGLRDVTDPSLLSVGQLLCDPQNPIHLVTRFRAQILSMDYKKPMLKGEQVLVYGNGVAEPGFLSKLIALVDKATNQTYQKKPRVIPRNVSARVEITLERPIALERYKDTRELGRFTLRRGNATVAVGIVTRIVELWDKKTGGGAGANDDDRKE